MLSRLAADAVLLLHLGFILFALLGGWLALRWHWLPVIHLPAAGWGGFVELSGRTCPLTGLENHFRDLAGQAGYAESFVEHYLLGVIYPDGLTREVQFLLAGAVLLVNALAYLRWWRHRR